MGKEFTKREKEIYKYLVETPLTYPQIAKCLGLSTGTLATHKTNIYYKKVVNSREELIIKHYKEREEKLTGCLNYFIKRVEEGSIISRKTYAKFKETLEELQEREV